MNKTIISLILLSSFTSLAAGAAESPLQENVPERYIVVAGDTLWGIAARFLKDPWRWPEVWGMNREQIKNPHRIYPGDVIVLDKTGTPAMRVARETVQLSPKIRVEQREVAIPSIPPAAIEPYLSQPLVIEEKGLEQAPRIIAAPEHRVVLGGGDIAYVQGLPKDLGLRWQIYRPGKALIDPETEETLGYEAIYLGDARVLQFGEVSAVEIVKANQEIARGDRLVPSSGTISNTYVPHAPDKRVSGRIISTYGGLAEAGQNMIVTINRGSRDGLEKGHVLGVHRHAETVAYSRSDSPVILPGERTGLIFLFRIFDKVSYALVVQSQRQINVLDRVQTP